MQSTQNTIVVAPLCRPEPMSAYIVSNAAGESPQLERLCRMSSPQDSRCHDVTMFYISKNIELNPTRYA
jgi:hypothetical protein